MILGETPIKTCGPPLVLIPASGIFGRSIKRTSLSCQWNTEKAFRLFPGLLSPKISEAGTELEKRKIWNTNEFK
jgi:hypothetical protein